VEHRAPDMPAGHSKCNIARVLTELAVGGVARSRRERNALAFHLANVQTWRTLLDDMGSPGALRRGVLARERCDGPGRTYWKA
jgi:hypothetical protein